jgi:hypothetical protein
MPRTTYSMELNIDKLYFVSLSCLSYSSTVHIWCEWPRMFDNKFDIMWHMQSFVQTLTKHKFTFFGGNLQMIYNFSVNITLSSSHWKEGSPGNIIHNKSCGTNNLLATVVLHYFKLVSIDALVLTSHYIMGKILAL